MIYRNLRIVNALPIDCHRNAAHVAHVGKFRRHKRAIGWLGLVAMLCNVLLAIAPEKAAPLADDILGPLIICTSHGAQVIANQGDIPQSGDPSGSHCPACTIVKSYVLALVPPLLEFAWPAESVLHIAWSPTRGAVSQLKLGGIGSRAPPTFI
jgi:hypothetical protein